MTSRVPDLDALRLLVAVGETGSIGAAARARGVSQQSASERLRVVETQVGLPLLRRTARGSGLTPSGVVVTRWATRLLDLADEIDHALEGLVGDRDRGLAVWSSLTVAESLLPRWLVLLRQRQLAEKATPTTVALTAANSQAVLGAVREQQADVGFVESAEAPHDLAWTAVAADELVLVTAPGTPLARRRSALAPKAVAELTLTSREAGSGTRDVVERALAGHQLAPTSLVELTTGTAIRAAVLAGGPAAFLSGRLVAADLAAGQLVEVPVRGLDLRRTFRAVWVGGREPPAGPVRELVGLARSHGGA